MLSKLDCDCNSEEGGCGIRECLPESSTFDKFPDLEEFPFRFDDFNKEVDIEKCLKQKQKYKYKYYVQ